MWCLSARLWAESQTIPLRPPPTPSLSASAGVFKIPVLGKTNGAVNSAVVKGDKLFVATATAIVSKDTTGVFYGYALGAVNGGATTTIPVLLAQSV
jgi:hypothetical protein